MMKAISVSVINAMVASVAPNAREPVSPIKILAGWTLNHKNASKIPLIIKQNADKIYNPRIYVIAPYAIN